MPQLFIFFLFLPLMQNCWQIQFYIVEDVHDNEQNEPNVTKKAKDSVSAIDEI